MGDLYAAGGMFMTPLTILGIAAIILAVKKIVDVFTKQDKPAAQHRPMVNLVLQLGILSFFVGILSQSIGLIDAFQIIEQAGGVGPSLLAGGLKVSMIAPVYGLIILIIAFVLWSVLKYRLDTAV